MKNLWTIHAAIILVSFSTTAQGGCWLTYSRTDAENTECNDVSVGCRNLPFGTQCDQPVGFSPVDYDCTDVDADCQKWLPNGDVHCIARGFGTGTTTLKLCPKTFPSGQPSHIPTDLPTNQPTLRPSLHPSDRPTIAPTSMPSGSPTTTPTVSPTIDTAQYLSFPDHLSAILIAGFFLAFAVVSLGGGAWKRRHFALRCDRDKYEPIPDGEESQDYSGPSQ